MKRTNDTAVRILTWVTFLWVAVALWGAFFYAPREATLGDVQRIFYFHLPIAIMTFVAFFIVFVCGILYLRTRNPKWDTLAVSSAETGIVFCTLALITGSTWGKASWGTWWTWDPRLTTTLILWLIYVAYLMLRSSIDESRRAAFSAVFGMVGFVDVPIVFMSIRWWRSIHPQVFEWGSINLAGSMVTALMIGMGAMACVLASIIVQRYRVEKLANALAEIKQRHQML